MLDEVTIECPYCGESFTTVVDYSAGAQQYIEDCFVCCRPIIFHVHVTSTGELKNVTVMAEND